MYLKRISSWKGHGVFISDMDQLPGCDSETIIIGLYDFDGQQVDFLETSSFKEATAFMNKIYDKYGY